MQRNTDKTQTIIVGDLLIEIAPARDEVECSEESYSDANTMLSQQSDDYYYYDDELDE